MILREKIVETHELQKIINDMNKRATKSKKEIYKKALANNLELRNNCYSIAKKLNIK